MSNENQITEPKPAAPEQRSGAVLAAPTGSALECQGCKWWQADDDDNEENTTGICRRNPPQLSGGSYGFVSLVFGFIWRSSETEWPETDAFDYCGEHTPNDKVSDPRQ